MNLVKVYTEEEIKTCIELRKSGLSLAKIARKMKTDDKKLRKILVDAGFEIGGSFLRRTELTINYFEKIDTPEKAYWLGYIAADGCVHRHGWKVSIISKDADILPKFQKAIGATSPVRYREIFDKRTNKTYSSHSIQICSKQFADFVRSQGIDGDKSSNFKFPTHLDKNLWVHFIRGMFDGDGGLMIRFDAKNTLYKTTKINIVSTLDGAIFLRDFTKNELGFTVQKLRSVPEQGIHYFEMTKDSIKFLEWIYSCSKDHMRLNRKYEKYLLSKRLYDERQPIYRIENCLTGEIFETREFLAFCKDSLLNPTYMKYIFDRRNESKRNGIYKNWRIISIIGKIPKGRVHL